MTHIHSISRILLSISLLFFFISSSVRAQDNFDEFIEAGSADANTIYEAYGTPLLSGLNWAFSRGWYNTAKAHKPLGFDFSLNVSVAFIPNKDKFFNAADVVSGWNANASDPARATRFVGNATRYPSMAGSNDLSQAPIVEIYNPATDQFESVTGPVGLDYTNDIISAAVPVAMPQFGIGLIKNTDLKFRFLPSVGSDDVKLNMFGVGLMHDIKQWIPGNSLIPIDISVMVAYSNIGLDVLNIDDDPGDDGFFDLTSWSYQLLVSKEFHILTIYGGFGYMTSTNNIDIVGSYNVISAGDQPIVDPVSLETKDSGFNASLGLRLKLAVLTIHADYSIQEYQTFNAGIGVSLR